MSPEAQQILCFFLILVVPLAAAGLALMNTGLGRSRSAAHTMLASLCMFAVAVLAYLVASYALQRNHGFPDSLGILLSMLSAGIGAMIPLGTGSDRWRLSACCFSAALFGGLVFPLFSHWVWNAGWLAQAGFQDTGGASTIHVSGGMAALSIGWLLGPRRGKYVDGLPAALPGHDVVLVILGCLLALVGWLGLNCAGAILYHQAASGALVLVAMNTLLAACSAALAAAVVTRTRYNRPDASLCANGWTGGLVAASAVAGFANPLAAALIGLIAGALVALSVEMLDLRLGLDDPGGAISVHGVAGIWGLLAVSFFAHGSWIAQLAGIATLLGFVFPVVHCANWALGRFHHLRVAAEGERTGMDLHELGAGAYPDFVTHHDDLFSR
jgi:Amt family ammonium transporter